MTRTSISHVRRLAILLLAFALWVVPVWAQQVSLQSVSPGEGQPGQTLDLTLRGGGFGGANWARVTVGEFEATDVRIESDQVIRARLSIPAGAQPGPRDVQVVVSFGQNEDFSAVLPGGFSVAGAAAPPPEPRDGDGEERRGGGGDDWSWVVPVVVVLVGGLVVGGGAVTLTVALKARQSALRRQWQQEATEEELPKTCQGGTHRVVREKPEVKPGRWKVTGLKVTLHNAAEGRHTGDRREASHDVPPELVQRIDRAARDRLLWGEEERLTQEAGEIGRELAALVTAWQSLSKAGRDFRLEPRIEGGEASVKFTLYRCVGQPGGWKKVADWEAKLQAVDYFPRSLPGFATDEPTEAYRAAMARQLSDYALALIRQVGRLLGRGDVAFSSKVSIG